MNQPPLPTSQVAHLAPAATPDKPLLPGKRPSQLGGAPRSRAAWALHKQHVNALSWSHRTSSFSWGRTKVENTTSCRCETCLNKWEAVSDVRSIPTAALHFLCMCSFQRAGSNWIYSRNLDGDWNIYICSALITCATCIWTYLHYMYNN